MSSTSVTPGAAALHATLSRSQPRWIQSGRVVCEDAASLYQGGLCLTYSIESVRR